EKRKAGLSARVAGALRLTARECSVALSVAAIVFPPFALGFKLWNQPPHAFHWNPPPDLVSLFFAEICVVGLPEEALFRGYFQTRLADLWPKTLCILRVPLSLPSWIGQACLFALVHFLVEPHPARLAVFFPGLLFGWLRAWRGGIGAALIFHSLCNIY